MARRTRLIASGTMALVLTIAMVGSASATPPQAVTFTGTFTEGSPIGTFDASAPLCDGGSTLDIAGLAAGYQSQFRMQLVVAKQFTCTEEDTFTLLLQVHLTFAPEYTNHFTWTVLRGTGAFADLHGTGTGSAVPTATGGTDTYVGRIHFD